MGIALLAASALAHPLTALHRWWNRQRPAWAQHHSAQADVPARAAAVPRLPHPAGGQPRSASVPRTCATPGGTRQPRALDLVGKPPARPSCALPPASGSIRVLRGHGRMVIAGRMADVCAELERLAACEPQH